MAEKVWHGKTGLPESLVAETFTFTHWEHENESL